MRERNVLLLAAGYAPAYAETPLDAEVMAPARAALDAVLSGHHPFPAVIVDGRWDLMSANEPALALLERGRRARAAAAADQRDAGEPPPRGARPAHRQPRRVRRPPPHPGPTPGGAVRRPARSRSWRARWPATSAWTASRPLAAEPADLLFVPLRLRSGGDELSFFSTLASFGTALDITLAELAIEAFFPADDATRTILRQRFG